MTLGSERRGPVVSVIRPTTRILGALHKRFNDCQPRTVVSKKRGSIVLLVMAVTALLVAPLVLFGVYLGYYMGDLVGYSGSIMAIVFSTVGFLAAIAILMKVIVKIVARAEANG
jgi:F0F1-type ATP synthase assembly protein I